MCGRYVAAASPSLLASHFSVDEAVLDDEELAPSWNVAPTARVPAVAVASDGRRLLGAFRWGLVPAWAPDPSGGARMINARAETVAEKPAYREALVRRRCILPADGFYEWKLGAGAMKQPVFVAAADGSPLAFAGLWEVWRDPGAPAGSPALRTCTIITTAANDRLAGIHPRMPVVLPPSAWDVWLDRSVRDPARLAPLLTAVPDDLLEPREVCTLVNDVRNDGAELLSPAR